MGRNPVTPVNIVHYRAIPAITSVYSQTGKAIPSSEGDSVARGQNSKK